MDIKLILTVIFLILLSGLDLKAQSDKEEYHNKATYLYHFIQYTQWPEVILQNDKRINLCVASTNVFTDILFTLANKLVKLRNREILLIIKNRPSHRQKRRLMLSFQDRHVKGRTIEVKKLDQQEIDCHLLFISSQNKDFIIQTLDLVKNTHILTVGEHEDFIKMGGIINFFKEDGRLRFQVNLAAAQNHGLKFSSQLLRSAVITNHQP